MCEAKKLYLWLLQVIGLLGLLALCLWLSLRPKSPSFTIVEFSVPTVTSQNSSAGDDEDATLSYTLEISNPSKDSSIHYDDILLIFYFGQDTLGKNKIPAFNQGKDKSIQKSNHVDASDQKVEKALGDAISKGKADLKVDLSSKVQYKTWGIKNKHHVVKLQASIPVGSDGKISGKKKKIKLRSPSKKWKLRTTKSISLSN